MVGNALTTSLAMAHTTRTLCARGPFCSRVFLQTPRKHVQVRSAASIPPSDAAKRTVEEMKKAGSHIKEHLASQTENMANESKDAAGKVAGTAENMAEKAKQKAQDAWKAAKDAAQKVKENVSEKADDAADAVKENIDVAKRKISKD
uniref:protein DR_1172-like n=1 Tax=Erigeron canadensis TaxID=72917 RepID=UPI001CB93129|nr:protein DR_1172-like [Erigeron canadensis]